MGNDISSNTQSNVAIAKSIKVDENDNIFIDPIQLAKEKIRPQQEKIFAEDGFMSADERLKMMKDEITKYEKRLQEEIHNCIIKNIKEHQDNLLINNVCVDQIFFVSKEESCYNDFVKDIDNTHSKIFLRILRSEKEFFESKKCKVILEMLESSRYNVMVDKVKIPCNTIIGKKMWKINVMWNEIALKLLNVEIETDTKMHKKLGENIRNLLKKRISNGTNASKKSINLVQALVVHNLLLSIDKESKEDWKNFATTDKDKIMFDKESKKEFADFAKNNKNMRNIVKCEKEYFESLGYKLKYETVLSKNWYFYDENDEKIDCIEYIPDIMWIFTVSWE
jgi:hypothetical protein